MLFSDDVRTESGRAFGRELRARIPDARMIYVDPRIAAGMSDEVLKAVDEAKTVVAAVYVVPTAGKSGKCDGYGGRDRYAAAASCWIMQPKRPRSSRWETHTWRRTSLRSENYMCTFSNATVSEIAAVKALFGEIAIRGHLPVSIPNVAPRGTGIERPVQVASGGS